MERKKFVVVTTDKDRRGVFAGYLEKHTENEVVLSKAMMCIYWSKETKGVLGLASRGPQSGSRITDEVPSIKLNGVTSIIETTEEAKKTWQKKIWD